MTGEEKGGKEKRDEGEGENLGYECI
jgi:hypothetical protein